MSEIIKILLSLSLSGTALILLLLLFRPLYRERLSKSWQYYIFLVVIFRLLLPITPETSLTGNLFLAAERILPRITTSALLPKEDRQSAVGSIPQSESDTGRIDTIPDAMGSGSNDSETPAGDSLPYTAIQPDTAGAAAAKDADGGSRPAGSLLFSLWLVVALLLLMRKVTVYQSFRKYVDAGCRPLDDMKLLECFGHIMEENHIKGSIDLCSNSLISSPLLIGLFRPCIILPAADLPECDFYYTALHELTHYRRRDMLYKWLVQLTLCVHWFNPLVYLMKNEANRLCELSCDECVLKSLPENARRAYGDTLLNAAGSGGSYKDTLASVTLHESKELLKGRLHAIMNYKKLSKPAQLITVLITGILTGGAVVLGAYAAPGRQPASDAVPMSEDRTDPDAAQMTNGSTEADTDRTAWAAAFLPDYRIECEDTIYYIYVDGADETDKPLSNVTEGLYKLVFVYKDRYSTFGTYREKDMTTLVRHVESMCRTMLENGQITQEDKDLYLLTANDIQSSFRSGEESAGGTYWFNSLNNLGGLNDSDDSGLDAKDYDDDDLSDYLDDRGLLAEYNANNIVTAKNDYYYQNARVRILMDVRRTADENITPRRSDASSSGLTITDLTRVTWAEVPDKVQNALNACEDGNWYVIESDNFQYIYYNGLPHTYAYEPQISDSETGDLITIDIVDITTESTPLHKIESGDNYVLLAFSYAPDDPAKAYELAIQYNQTPVTYKRSQAK